MELPLVTPQQVATARKVKYIFTGDLNAQIKSYPPFPGKEKHLVLIQFQNKLHKIILINNV